jgi:thymidine kinase
MIVEWVEDNTPEHWEKVWVGTTVIHRHDKGPACRANPTNMVGAVLDPDEPLFLPRCRNCWPHRPKD